MSGLNRNDRELLQQALDALEKHIYEYETIQAIKARLAQPKPVGCIIEEHTTTPYGGDSRIKSKNVLSFACWYFALRSTTKERMGRSDGL